MPHPRFTHTTYPKVPPLSLPSIPSICIHHSPLSLKPYCQPAHYSSTNAGHHTSVTPRFHITPTYSKTLHPRPPQPSHPKVLHFMSLHPRTPRFLTQVTAPTHSKVLYPRLPHLTNPRFLTQATTPTHSKIPYPGHYTQGSSPQVKAPTQSKVLHPR